MPTLATPGLVETDGALTPSLFNLPDQNALDALVQSKLNVADAWLQQRAGPTIYNSADPIVQALLAQAESYLALHYLIPIIKSEKVYGTHAPYMSEESASYDTLVERNYRQEAMDLLDPFLSLEDVPGKGFAPPQFFVTTTIDPLAVESEEDQLEDSLEFSRGISEIPFATVRR